MGSKISFGVSRSVFVIAAAVGLLARTAAAQDYPAGAIAGPWLADAHMSSSASGGAAPGYWWVGRISLGVAKTGSLAVSAANGCRISGLAMPMAGGGYQGLANMTNCPDPQMNRRYVLLLNGGKPNLSFSMTSSVFNPGGNMNYEVRAVMMRPPGQEP